jgi:hypothetical protein
MTYKKFKNIRYLTFIIFLAILSFLFVNSARSDIARPIDCILKNLCKGIYVKYSIYLPKDLIKTNYYLLDGSLYSDMLYINSIQKPNDSYYSWAIEYNGLSEYPYLISKAIYLIKREILETYSVLNYDVKVLGNVGSSIPIGRNILFIKSDDGTNCIAIESIEIRDLIIKYNLQSIENGRSLINKIDNNKKISNADYKNLLNILKKEKVNFLPCNEFLNNLIKIKFARPEDSDESVLRKLAQQLGVYDNYPLGYIPVMSPIRGLEIEYKADPEVKDGYITLTKLRATIYLDDGTKKEFESSLTTTTPTTTSTNVITPTTSFQSIPTKPTSSQSLLLNLWFKIKCLFLRLIGKAC